MAMDIEAGFLTRQIQGVHKDLLGFEEKTDKKLREHDARFDRLEQDVSQVKQDVRGLRTDMPKIVGNTMREVLREERGRK
jgi:hypothetical protein